MNSDPSQRKTRAGRAALVVGAVIVLNSVWFAKSSAKTTHAQRRSTTTTRRSTTTTRRPVTSTPRVSPTCIRSGQWRILLLGDSLTRGDDRLGFADSYRPWLWRLLRSDGFVGVDFVGNQRLSDGSFDGDNSGFGGFATGPDNGFDPFGAQPSNLYAYIEKFILQPYLLNEAFGQDWVTFSDPDLVILNVGTNDHETDATVMQRRLGDLVSLILRRAPTARVIVSSLPPQGGDVAITPFVGQAAAKIAAANPSRVLYADVRTRMTEGDRKLGAEPFDGDTDWRGGTDQTHLSASGGRKFGIALLPTVEQALRLPRCA